MSLVSSMTRPNKKIPVFRVTRPYLNLLVKPRFFFFWGGGGGGGGVWKKNII